MKQGDAVSADLAAAISAAQARTGFCRACGFFAPIDAAACAVCEDPGRETTVLCVVEQPTDVIAIDRTGAFRGKYHCLHGKISPLDNIGPEDLWIDALLQRVRESQPEEVILAVGSDVEGEATANYLAAKLSPFSGVAVSRLAQGLPAGGGLESADELTLFRALDGRRRCT